MKQIDSDLRDRIRSFESEKLAPSTRVCYGNHMANFERWCKKRGVQSLPTSAETAGEFICEMASSHRPRTITSMLCAIGHAHYAAGLEFDRSRLDSVVAGIRRVHGTAVEHTLPVSIDQIRVMVDAMPCTRRGIRDRAILLTGFAGALRSSEIYRLSLNKANAGGIGTATIDSQGVKITILKSACGFTAPRSITKFVRRGYDPCPVEALEMWLAAAKLKAGLVFRSFDRRGSISELGIGRNGVNSVVKEAVINIELRAGKTLEHSKAIAENYNSDSLRSGFVASAIARGADLEHIALHLGWTTTQMAKRYRQNHDRVHNNALRWLMT